MATSKISNSPKGSAAGKTVTTLSHDEAKRKNIPTAEYQLLRPTINSDDQVTLFEGERSAVSPSCLG